MPPTFTRSEESLEAAEGDENVRQEAPDDPAQQPLEASLGLPHFVPGHLQRNHGPLHRSLRHNREVTTAGSAAPAGRRVVSCLAVFLYAMQIRKSHDADGVVPAA